MLLVFVKQTPKLKRSGLTAQGIETEIPQELRSNSEELEWKARFFEAKPQKMRPNLYRFGCANPLENRLLSGQEGEGLPSGLNRIENLAQKWENTYMNTKGFIVLVTGLVFSGCVSGPRVTRIEPGSLVDLSGRWNDTDVRMVCGSLITDCLNSPRVNQFVRQFSVENQGKLPACLVGTFKNESSEHIDTSIISKTMEAAIVNSGRMDFVAGGAVREELRAERQDQQVNADESSASALGYERGADFLLTGTVKSMVERVGNTTVRSYFVSAELTNIKTNTRLWMGENSEIKKVVRQSRTRL